MSRKNLQESAMGQLELITNELRLKVADDLEYLEQSDSEDEYAMDENFGDDGCDEASENDEDLDAMSFSDDEDIDFTGGLCSDTEDADSKSQKQPHPTNDCVIIADASCIVGPASFIGSKRPALLADTAPPPKKRAMSNAAMTAVAPSLNKDLQRVCDFIRLKSPYNCYSLLYLAINLTSARNGTGDIHRNGYACCKTQYLELGKLSNAYFPVLFILVCLKALFANTDHRYNEGGAWRSKYLGRRETTCKILYNLLKLKQNEVFSVGSSVMKIKGSSKGKFFVWFRENVKDIIATTEQKTDLGTIIAYFQKETRLPFFAKQGVNKATTNGNYVIAKTEGTVEFINS